MEKENSDSSCEWTKLDELSSKWVGLKGSASMCGCVIVYDGLGIPVVADIPGCRVCVGVCVCACACVSACV